VSEGSAKLVQGFRTRISWLEDGMATFVFLEHIVSGLGTKGYDFSH